MKIKPKTIGLAIFALGGVAIGHGVFELIFDRDATSGLVWVGIGLVWTAFWLGIRAWGIRNR